MHPPFRYLSTAIAAGSICVTMLQYHWTAQLRAAELDRLQFTVRNAVAAFARDLAVAGPEALSPPVLRQLAAKYFESSPVPCDIEIRDGAKGSVRFRSTSDPRTGPPLLTAPLLAMQPPPAGPGDVIIRVPLAAPPLELRVWSRTATLEEMADQHQNRNLAMAASALILLLGSGIVALHTGRSAQLAGARQIRFVAGVSHELKTPVSVIRSAGQNLRQGIVSNTAEVQEYGGLVEQGAERLGRTLQRVLTIASSTERHAHVSRELLDVSQFVREVAGSWPNVTVQLHCSHECRIEADRCVLQTAVEDLVSNAAKHATRSSHILLSASSGDGRVRISVQDAGPGIPNAELQTVFEPFRRGTRAIREQVEGSGLGLYLVSCVARAHGGEVRVHSSPETGSTFILDLPEARA